MRLSLRAIGIAMLAAAHYAAGQPMSPGPRGGGHALAYDSRRGMSMLYGDRGPDATTLWGWDGITWHAFNQPGPGLRRHIKLAYESARDRLVLYGGFDDSGRILNSDTWEWDGGQASSPLGRAGAYMVYDAARGHTLLFGGWTYAGASKDVVYPDDLWAWDGGTWRKLEPAPNTPRPIGRDAPVLAYDEARQRVVMFGGRGDGTGQPPTWPTDVWEWDETRWYRITNGGMPRILHPMASYDPARRRVVLAGGAFLTETGGFARLARTLWEWDGARWTARDTAGPENYFPGAIATTRSGGIILVGGPPGVNRDSARVSSRTFVFSGSTWTAREDAPAFNNLQAVAGAPDGTLYMYQSWESWLASPLMHVRDVTGVWRRVESSLNPGVRNTQALAWDSRRNRLVLFGGQGRDQRLLDDTWEFDGRTWVKR